MSDDRRSTDKLLMDAINRIDSRTERMDERLQKVEHKLNNGINDRMDHLEQKLGNAEVIAYEAVRSTREWQAVKEHRKAELFKWLRILGAGTALIGAVVALISL